MRILSCLGVRDQTRVPQDPHVVQLSLHPRFHGALPLILSLVFIGLLVLKTALEDGLLRNIPHVWGLDTDFGESYNPALGFIRSIQAQKRGKHRQAALASL